ncbi:ketopantoate reductase family protein [uncultured Amnibacterium sp.]|uniref:ketopantoate reductase family protein n=1 Tax=uncultured Amnibacterium sp. TaxID=1631851 RepID=UPI0035CA12B2
MSRSVVIGAGAIGALLAAQLELAGRETVLVARGEALAAIRDRGVVVARPSRTETVPVTVAGGPEEVDLRPDDVLFLAVKAQDADAALAAWAWRPVGPDGVAAELPIVTLQNGLAAEEAAARRFARVLGATIAIAAQHLTAGEVASPAEPEVGLVWLGAHGGGTDPLLQPIAADLRAAAYEVTVTDDIGAVKAWKLLGNLGNALDLFDGAEEDLATARRLLRNEALAVYAAAGMPVAAIDVADLRLQIGEVPGYRGGRLSTWQSFARGTSSEVDFLNGEIVLLGRRTGIPTPVNALVQRTLGEHAARGHGVELVHPVEALLSAGRQEVAA